MELCIARIYYPVKTLGPGLRIGIWTAGCDRKCECCISPELQSFNNGRDMNTAEIMDLINSIKKPADGVTISGGEPFARPEPLSRLVTALSSRYDDIIIFTGYTYDELLKSNDPNILAALSNCSMLIDGPYMKEYHTNIGLRGSTNQEIHILKKHGEYQSVETEKRTLQNVIYGNKILTIGIP